MENILKSMSVPEHKPHITEILGIYRLTGLFFILCKKVIKLFVSLREFVEYHSFYEGEHTNSSVFYTKIGLINRLNNKNL